MLHSILTMGLLTYTGWTECSCMVTTAARKKQCMFFVPLLALIYTHQFVRFQNCTDMLPEAVFWEDAKGRTLLWYAVNHNRKDFVHCLLEYHACAETPDHKGATPLMLATSHKDREITALLNAFKSKNVH